MNPPRPDRAAARRSPARAEPLTRTRRRAPARGATIGASARAWLVLVVLLVVVGALSLGRPDPLTAIEALRGLTFSRPAASNLAFSSGHPDPVLQTRIDGAVGLSRGNVSAAVLDLDSGALATVDADRSFPSASLFKLPILIEVLAQQQVHRLDPDRLLEVRPEDWTDGSGVLQARVGERLTVRELMRLMIQESDNIAALVLLDAVGSDSVNATLDRLGLPTTRVVDRRRGGQGEHVTTARDTATLLSIIATGQLIDPSVSEDALRLLEQKQAHTWLAESLPWWVKVAHKWGDLPAARHDAGIVYTPRGTFVSVVLTEGAAPDEAEQVIARTAQAAYEYLGTTARGRVAART